MQKQTPKCFKCGEEIYFDRTQRSKNNKPIPLDPVTNKPHDCPHSSFRKQKTIGDEILDLDQRESENIKRIKYD